MNVEKMIDAIGGIGDDLIVEAKESRAAITPWRLAAAAACLVVLISALYIALGTEEPSPDQPLLQNTTVSTVQPTTAAPTLAPFVPASTVALPTAGQEILPIQALRITSSEAYRQLLLAAEDRSVFVQNQNLIITFGNQGALIQFVKKLKQLPLPNIERMYCTYLEYNPNSSQLNIVLHDGNGNVCNFVYELDEANAASIRTDIIKQNKFFEQEWVVPGATLFKTITRYEPINANYQASSCWMELDGTLVYLHCTGSYANMSTDAVFSLLSVGNDFPWN